MKKTLLCFIFFNFVVEASDSATDSYYKVEWSRMRSPVGVLCIGSMKCLKFHLSYDKYPDGAVRIDIFRLEKLNGVPWQDGWIDLIVGAIKQKYRYSELWMHPTTASFFKSLEHSDE